MAGTVSLGESQLRAGRLQEAHACTYQERGCEPPERPQAEAHSRQALTLAEALGMRPLQARCHCGLGTLYATIGQQEPSCAALSRAIELYRAMAMTLWLPEAEAALAQGKGDDCGTRSLA